GASLVEVMVSFVILTVSLLGTLSTVMSADLLQKRTAQQDAAERAASDTIEQIRELGATAALQQFQGGTSRVEDGQTLAVSFPTTALTSAIPGLCLTTTCFSAACNDGSVQLNSSQSTVPGLLPVRIVVGSGPGQFTVQALVIKP